VVLCENNGAQKRFAIKAKRRVVLMNNASIYLLSWVPTALVLIMWMIPIACAIWFFRSLRRIETKIDAIQRRMSGL
jgi:hypothetical protein